METGNKENINQVDDGKKILCAVKNPNNVRYRNDKSWFYNIFLKRIYKTYNPTDRNEIKVNWLIALDPDEVNLLRNHNCKVIPLLSDVSLDEIDDEYEQTFKEGFTSLLKLFNDAMTDSEIKSKVRKMLTGNDGKPSQDYINIMKTKKLLEE